MTRPGLRGKAHRVKRSRPITHPAPEVLAMQDAVLLGHPENPYPPGCPNHSIYNDQFERTRSGLPEDWAPEYPKRIGPRQK